MRLSDFLRSSQQAIIAYSVDYAFTIPAYSGSMATLEILRDHLPHILDQIADDLDQPQTRKQSILKSRGLAPPQAASTAAELHGKTRAVSGLSIEQLFAEFRVLRSSVLRLWSEACTPGEFTSEDTLRFNEAIDQAVAESVAFFHAEVEQWRSLLLGVLGHDLRGPLHAVLLTTEVLAHETADGPLAPRVEAIARSAQRMNVLLDSLLEYNNAALGSGMVIHRAPTDLVRACEAELAVLRAALPGRAITFTAPGTCQADVDSSRIREALANLVHNASQHGLPGPPIDVELEQAEQQLTLSVINAAQPIDPLVLQGLFEPLRQRAENRSTKASRNLGLGLFIVRSIARAHGGDATATMVGDRVRFSVTIPKG